MRNCSSYIAKQKRKAQLPLLPYAPLSVIIPCYNEPDILKTLHSIWSCKNYEKGLNVIVVINHNERSSNEIIEQNAKTQTELEQFAQYCATRLRTISVLSETFSKNTGGVGDARKIGMDEAIAQYVQHERDGVIISLDADTLIAENYLEEIDKHFSENPKTNTLIINYEHQLAGLPDFQKEAIIQYELYLRYMTLAYRHIGHPNAFHTIGSAFAVRASSYCKQNGMNRRQAGEDFYFLQKMMSLGACSELNTSCVFPASRISDRVPFGTGKAIKELIDSGDELKTYCFKCFEELKTLFDLHQSFYRIAKADYEQIVYNELGGLIKSWLIEDNFFKELEKINANCASMEMFSKKFFESFSILQVIKFLNFSHTNFLQKVGIFHAVNCLPNSETFDFSNSEKLLFSVRKYLQKGVFVKG